VKKCRLHAQGRSSGIFAGFQDCVRHGRGGMGGDDIVNPQEMRSFEDCRDV
jgi:hypothetical protein